MTPISPKAQIIEGFVLVDKKSIPKLEESLHSKGQMISEIAHTLISATASAIFCAMYPPSSPIALTQMLSVGIITGIAAEHIDRTIHS